MYVLNIHLQSDSLMLSLYIVYHFFKTILSYFVPVWAAINFFRSPIVSSGLHFTRTFSEKYDYTHLVFLLIMQDNYLFTQSVVAGNFYHFKQFLEKTFTKIMRQLTIEQLMCKFLSVGAKVEKSWRRCWFDSPQVTSDFSSE